MFWEYEDISLHTEAHLVWSTCTGFNPPEATTFTALDLPCGELLPPRGEQPVNRP